MEYAHLQWAKEEVFHPSPPPFLSPLPPLPLSPPPLPSLSLSLYLWHQTIYVKVSKLIWRYPWSSSDQSLPLQIAVTLFSTLWLLLVVIFLTALHTKFFLFCKQKWPGYSKLLWVGVASQLASLSFNNFTAFKSASQFYCWLQKVRFISPLTVNRSETIVFFNSCSNICNRNAESWDYFLMSLPSLSAGLLRELSCFVNVKVLW